ncbi:MAG TPA: type II toxin-antitoxin system MqsA family antitoxin [Thermoanaerobaculia bacterium]|jgi:YgiT-type zinc finger domain-containing protein|nr:type II toxin-antitoxin system MqsA family antitoxin [Thermoanaerobaculia bacterium]
MKCRVCGGTQQPTNTDLPFKTGERSIVIIKSLPVIQCPQCYEYSIDDPTLRRVEETLARVDSGAELEIIPFAAEFTARASLATEGT